MIIMTKLVEELAVFVYTRLHSFRQAVAGLFLAVPRTALFGFHDGPGT